MFAGVPVGVPADAVGGGATGGSRLGVAAVAGWRRRGGYADSACDRRRQRSPAAAAARGSAGAVIVVVMGGGRRSERAVLDAVRSQPRTFLHRSAADRPLSTVSLYGWLRGPAV